MTQISLSDYTPPSQPTPTSEAAARAIAPRAGTLRAMVLGWLRAHPDGATDQEIQDALGLVGSTERPRRIELVAAGMVVDSGRVRKTEARRDAVVWVAV